MNRDYEIKTYYFKDNELNLKSVLHCDTNETEHNYYVNNRVKSTHWYFNNQPSSFTEYDEEGKTLFRMNFPLF